MGRPVGRVVIGEAKEKNLLKIITPWRLDNEREEKDFQWKRQKEASTVSDTISFRMMENWFVCDSFQSGLRFWRWLTTVR